jgi:peroxiredoxin
MRAFRNFVSIALGLLAGACGSNSAGEAPEPGATSSSTAQDDVAVEDVATASEGGDTSGDFVPWLCEKDDPDPVDYDYGDAYATGPYGFKGSLCWSGQNPQLSYEWGGAGDTVHDLCLPDQDGNEVCLSDYYGSEHDLLILVVTARWCPICNMAAQQEKKWLNGLKEMGYNPIIVSIMSSGVTQTALPTQADTQFWKKRYGLEGPVLLDADMAWANMGMIDSWYVGRRTQGLAGFPFFYYIHTSNMKVWDSFEGFPLVFQYAQWFKQEKDILTYCDGQPGAKAL